MWITIIHIVIVYYFCGASLVETTNFEDNHTSPSVKNLMKRSLGSVNHNLNNIKLRHQSRFPNFDKVMTKINNMKLINSDDKISVKLRHSFKKTTTTTTTTPKNHEEVFENYFDDDYENDKEDDDNWAEYEDDDYEEYEDFPEWQAEEPTAKPKTTTTTTTTPIPVYRHMSRISEMKWRMYGTREKVEENRKKELFNSNTGSETSATLARVHYMRVRSEGTCKKPLPRVISVQAEHPDPSRSYTPHCTVLHRCAEDTGCCLQHSMRCGPKTQEEVQLYFYAKTLGTLQSKIEKLTFWNHTECTCVEKTKTNATEFSGKHSNEDVFKSSNTRNIQRCNCPGSFIPTYKYESQCTCSCQETNPDCIRMKNGLEYFSLADRKCVLERKCGIPVCEFGAYLRTKGRCPRKEEKLEAFGHLNID